MSGQIIATSHDLTPKGGLVREIPLFQGNLGWWNILIWPDMYPVYKRYILPIWWVIIHYRSHPLRSNLKNPLTYSLGIWSNTLKNHQHLTRKWPMVAGWILYHCHLVISTPGKILSWAGVLSEQMLWHVTCETPEDTHADHMRAS